MNTQRVKSVLTVTNGYMFTHVTTGSAFESYTETGMVYVGESRTIS